MWRELIPPNCTIRAASFAVASGGGHLQDFILPGEQFFKVLFAANVAVGCSAFAGPIALNSLLFLSPVITERLRVVWRAKQRHRKLTELARFASAVRPAVQDERAMKSKSPGSRPELFPK